MRLFEGHVLELKQLSVELILLVSEHSRLIEELLKVDDHASFFQVVSLLASVVDVLKVFEVGGLEDLLDVLVHEGVEFLAMLKSI
jgi:hypothetical protein